MSILQMSPDEEDEELKESYYVKSKTRIQAIMICSLTEDLSVYVLDAKKIRKVKDKKMMVASEWPKVVPNTRVP